MNFYPRGFGGNRPDAETIRRDGWRGLGTLVIRTDDNRLTWPERKLIQQIGERLYGPCKKDGGTHG